MTAGCMEGLGTRRGSSLRIMFKLCVWFNSFGFCCVLYVTRREKKKDVCFPYFPYCTPPSSLSAMAFYHHPRNSLYR